MESKATEGVGWLPELGAADGGSEFCFSTWPGYLGVIPFSFNVRSGVVVVNEAILK